MELKGKDVSATDRLEFKLPPNWQEGRQSVIADTYDSAETIKFDQAISQESFSDYYKITISLPDMGSFLDDKHYVSKILNNTHPEYPHIPIWPKEVSDRFSLKQGQTVPTLSLAMVANQDGTLKDSQLFLSSTTVGHNYTTASSIATAQDVLVDLSNALFTNYVEANGIPLLYYTGSVIMGGGKSRLKVKSFDTEGKRANFTSPLRSLACFINLANVTANIQNKSCPFPQNLLKEILLKLNSPGAISHNAQPRDVDYRVPKIFE
jgi:exoribonuclease II